MLPSSRRLKVYAFDPETVMDVMVRFGQRAPKYVEVNKVNLPDDARVVNVSYDPWSLSMLFVIESETFDVAPDGQNLPVAIRKMDSKTYELKEGQ